MKRICFLGLISFCLGSLNAMSVKEPEPSCFYLAPVWDYLHSRWGNGTTQGGSMEGVLGGYSYIERDSLYFTADFNYMAGMLRGSAGNDPTQEYITQVRIGYNLVSPLWDQFTIAPFLGMGSYIFNQSLSASPDFTSHFWYVPIGVLFNFKVVKNWQVGLMVSGSPTFAGRYKLERTKRAPTTVLWKGELPVTYLGSLPFEFSLTPFIKTWAYSHSGELTKQINNYYGLKLVAGYHF